MYGNETIFNNKFEGAFLTGKEIYGNNKLNFELRVGYC